MTNSWLLGLSSGIWIMSAVSMIQSARRMKNSERQMTESERHMTEVFDDITAAQMRRSREAGE
jgi:hypothetical protein